jgi:DNA-binding IclR family transcriptional regulator
LGSLREIFGDSAQVKVLEFLVGNHKEAKMMSEVAAGAKVANSTTSRVIEPLVQSGIVKETRIGKQIRMFRLNIEDEKAKLLLRLVEGIKKLEDERQASQVVSDR